jgi:hypothetical protein
LAVTVALAIALPVAATPARLAVLVPEDALLFPPLLELPELPPPQAQSKTADAIIDKASFKPTSLIVPFSIII